jgi:hypothetical protein
MNMCVSKSGSRFVSFVRGETHETLATTITFIIIIIGITFRVHQKFVSKFLRCLDVFVLEGYGED